MKTCLQFAGLLTFVAFCTNASTQPLPSYYDRYNFLHASPGAFQEGLVGFANPANLRMLHALEARFYCSTDGADATSFEVSSKLKQLPRIINAPLPQINVDALHDHLLQLGLLFTDDMAKIQLAYEKAVARETPRLSIVA